MRLKAVILAAGVGSRIRPLTNDRSKFLLPAKDKFLGEIVMDNLIKAGISEFVFVIGHFSDKIKEFLKKRYKKFKIDIVENKIFEKTNTAYSLLLTKKYVAGYNFIKLDGDVYFEYKLIERLLKDKFENCIAIDSKINLDKEEVKVILDDKNNILKVGKNLNPKISKGESIGIEKLSISAGIEFFKELEKLMKDEKNYNKYYDDSYTTLVNKGIIFKAVDISDLKWVEIDTFDDYKKFLNLIDK